MKESPMTLAPVIAFAWNPSVGIPLLIVGVIILGLIWLFGQPRKEQGRRKPQPATPARAPERREPMFADEDDDASPRAFDEPAPMRARPAQGELDVDLRNELERLGASLAEERHGAPVISSASIEDILRSPAGTEPLRTSAPVAADEVPASIPAQRPAPPPKPAPPAAPPRSNVGRRPSELPVERIVSLYVVAREEGMFNGADLVVAAEKAGLEFGDMGIFHRLVDGRRELGPIFSVANLTKPGNFDMKRVEAMQTPGLSFFMALPGPVPALDAWDAMLPTAQRLAELLDGLVLDEERNALGRQRIAHIRDELRGWDRGHEGEEIKFGH
jgi:cell division protein ZipA